MQREIDLAESMRRLAFAADRQGCDQLNVHGLVSEAFREVDRANLHQIDSWFDEEFDRVRQKREQSAGFHVQSTGGENMPQPLKRFVAGAVQASVWENEQKAKDGQEFLTKTVRVERRYKDDKSGDWKSTSGFRPSDLPRVELVARKAFEFLALTERQPSDEPDGDRNDG